MKTMPLKDTNNITNVPEMKATSDFWGPVSLMGNLFVLETIWSTILLLVMCTTDQTNQILLYVPFVYRTQNEPRHEISINVAF